MKPATRRRIDDSWCRHFGMPESTLSDGGLHLTGPVDDWPGVFVVRLPGAIAVACPSEHHGLIAAVAARLGEAVTDPAAWLSELPGLAGAVIGPTRHSYNDEPASLGPPDERVLVAPPGIRAALQRLARSMPPEEWQEAGFDDPGIVFAIRDRRTVVAAAHLSPWDGHLADLGFVTRPTARGRGYGTVVAAAAARDAIERHGVARWRTRSSNAASVAVARRLGFEPYGEQIAIELCPARARPHAAG